MLHKNVINEGGFRTLGAAELEAVSGGYFNEDTDPNPIGESIGEQIQRANRERLAEMGIFGNEGNEIVVIGERAVNGSGSGATTPGGENGLPNGSDLNDPTSSLNYILDQMGLLGSPINDLLNVDQNLLAAGGESSLLEDRLSGDPDAREANFKMVVKGLIPADPVTKEIVGTIITEIRTALIDALSLENKAAAADWFDAMSAAWVGFIFGPIPEDDGSTPNPYETFREMFGWQGGQFQSGDFPDGSNDNSD